MTLFRFKDIIYVTTEKGIYHLNRTTRRMEKAAALKKRSSGYGMKTQ
jgi:hypothetical protein